MEILGIDVGGTGIKGALVDVETGKLTTEKYRITTPNPATPEAITNTIQKLVNHFNWKGSVGCGFPTPLQHGKCLTGGNLHEDWKGVQVDTLFESKTGNDYSIVKKNETFGVSGAMGLTAEEEIDLFGVRIVEPPEIGLYLHD